MSCARSERIARAAMIVAACLLAGCSSLEMKLPQDFLRVDDGGTELRAATPQDASLLVREFDDEAGGTLQFWAEALHNDLVDSRGYVATGEEIAVEDATGVPGIARIYDTRLAGRPHGYLCALFVLGSESDRRIRVAEFVAPSEEFAARSAEVIAALATLRR